MAAAVAFKMSVHKKQKRGGLCSCKSFMVQLVGVIGLFLNEVLISNAKVCTLFLLGERAVRDTKTWKMLRKG